MYTPVFNPDLEPFACCAGVAQFIGVMRRAVGAQPMNRVSCQPGLPMSVFLSRYGTGEQCEAAPLKVRWHDIWFSAFARD